MESYYLDSTGRQQLNERGISYIAALKASRFKAIVAMLERKVRQSGESASIFNSNTGEAATLHWSQDTTVGKKFVMSNAFKVVATKKREGEVLVFDVYKEAFNACDRFNKVMHGRTWPYRPSGKTRGGGCTGDRAASWNYLFTSLLINCWHLWLDKEHKTKEEKDWKEFCNELAVGIVISQD
ncbi:hypothetical protein D6817_03130 [Candidatus Pacearchaeota archaeon]|nr:MAG: hypothetical protein D6817_03130 [Candidatus Pacearchaeota archaeon]